MGWQPCPLDWQRLELSTYWCDAVAAAAQAKTAVAAVSPGFALREAPATPVAAADLRAACQRYTVASGELRSMLRRIHENGGGRVRVVQVGDLPGSKESSSSNLTVMRQQATELRKRVDQQDVLVYDLAEQLHGLVRNIALWQSIAFGPPEAVK
eukprot:SM000039S14509  [mRNA]  locus=s39:569370:570181:+ [translate_table: standard]